MAIGHAQPGKPVSLLDTNELLPGKTSALVKAEHFEAIHMVVDKGQVVAPHAVSGPITLHCLEGCIELDLDEGIQRLKSGQWVFLEGGVRHGLRGTEQSRLLLTIVLLPSQDISR